MIPIIDYHLQDQIQARNVPPQNTGKRSGEGLRELVNHLNDHFGLDLPNPQLYSPSVHHRDQSLTWRCYMGVKRLYFDRNADLNAVVNDLEEWVSSRSTSAVSVGALPASETAGRVKYFSALIDDALYLLSGGAYASFASRDANANANANANVIAKESKSPSHSPLKRRFSDGDDDDDEGEDAFHTAPNSPTKKTESSTGAEFSASLDMDRFRATMDNPQFRLDPMMQTRGAARVDKSSKGPARNGLSGFLEKLTAPDRAQYYDKRDEPRFSFSTGTTASSFGDSRSIRFEESFSTEITEPMDNESLYEDSIVGHYLSQEARMSFDQGDMMSDSSSEQTQRSDEQEIIEELLRKGPFSTEQSFPASVPLRYRYELERVGRAWNVPFDRMLVGNNISFKTYQGFWQWVEGHNQRGGRPLPEKSSRTAWDAATGDFKTSKHSEVAVLTGDLDWCSEAEPGILKLKLNPLRTDKSCRFHRRFGSDRFMSLNIPAPARPPKYLRFPSHPTLLRESIATWLTQHDHQYMGRTWRPFYVEEVKLKRKDRTAEPRFKVEFFAVDGIDFDHGPAPPIAPVRQSSDRHTPMTLESLIEWHMPRDANIKQSDCKLFQRFSLGLSKTFATVALKPSQVLLLKDDPDRPVMNDGCALMSRSLANEICDSLGISGNTPSCFQGRIAGAKGLWMVDRHQSQISGGGDSWIQISDSQLKINPHPHFWDEAADKEKLTFEVVKWSKPLHPVDLNVQLLGILEYGGQLKEYIAELTRAGIRSLYQDFAEVLQSNSNVLCRSLIQKVRPTSEDASGLASNNARRLEQWMNKGAECIIRLVEAGFPPLSFYPLRRRLGKCLKDLLDRYVDELRIEVPLSTYAFCIADPYGVLKADEVHFGFSSNWRDPQGDFEDNLLDGVDVLVGRLPAHLPSDIQRRRAVWKPELRHFKDVIVFPTKGAVPLAHMLSGGDYDGDTPWVCWDQNIVRSFRNSDLPEEDYPPNYFGLTKHSTPMGEVHSTEEFLENAFKFNLTLSNLGRCTVEHERISYDESIDSSKSKELACLLSHLVDSRKGGVHLSEQAWQQYRKTISPRARGLPAYRNRERKHKKSNIVDYLKFEIAVQERHAVLEKLERAFPLAESHDDIDEDLTRPWKETNQLSHDDKLAGGRLHVALAEITQSVDRLYQQWSYALQDKQEYSPAAIAAAESVKSIQPPIGGHPLFLLWQCSMEEWQRLLASYTYKRYPRSSFAIHAFGETLCRMKASVVPARMITNEMVACYKVNPKAVRQLTAMESAEEEDVDPDEFEGEDAVEAMLYGGYVPGVPGVPGEYYDPEDGMAVE